ncbi:hypothetical protein SAMD00024442_169_1 [Candidatus Symbiothrix dinenymphae]|nr:hypothetical protein SAMD00024442_169_1 [Candidatus Symbiothrix dinenymphae]
MNNKDEIVLYQPDNSIRLDVRVEEDSVWLTQAQMVELFETTKQNVSLHINNIFKEGELEKGATVKDYLTVQQEGGRNVQRTVSNYNLDVIISFYKSLLLRLCATNNIQQLARDGLLALLVELDGEFVEDVLTSSLRHPKLI